MKRFMLVSLLNCLLVGQVSCAWNWREFCKGVANTSFKAAAGAFVMRNFGRKMLQDPRRLYPPKPYELYAFGAALGALYNIAKPAYEVLCNITCPTTENCIEKVRQRVDLSDDTKSYYAGAIGSSAVMLAGLGLVASKLFFKDNPRVFV